MAETNPAGNMFAVPPTGNPTPASSEPQVHVSWVEFLLLRIAPKDMREAYLIWRFRYNVRHTRRDPEAPCPACGNRERNEMRWSPSFQWPDSKTGALIRQCYTCKAAWGERPIVAAEEWRISLRAQEEQSLFGEVRKSA